MARAQANAPAPTPLPPALPPPRPTPTPAYVTFCCAPWPLLWQGACTAQFHSSRESLRADAATRRTSGEDRRPPLKSWQVPGGPADAAHRRRRPPGRPRAAGRMLAATPLWGRRVSLFREFEEVGPTLCMLGQKAGTRGRTAGAAAYAGGQPGRIGGIWRYRRGGDRAPAIPRGATAFFSSVLLQTCPAPQALMHRSAPSARCACTTRGGAAEHRLRSCFARSVLSIHAGRASRPWPLPLQCDVHGASARGHQS